MVLGGADLFEDDEIDFEGVLERIEELLEQLRVLLVFYHIIIQSKLQPARPSCKHENIFE